jgi:hypothetical protein
MAWFQVSKSTNGKAWRAEIRRPNVSATVWELIAPEATFSTARDARRAVEDRYGILPNEWRKASGRGSSHWVAASNGMRHNDALPVRFIVADDGEFAGEVTALFPTLCGTNDGDMTCYAHIGQHSTASVEWASNRDHRDATAAERADLERELRGIYEQCARVYAKTLFVVSAHNRDWMRIARIADWTR